MKKRHIFFLVFLIIIQPKLAFAFEGNMEFNCDKFSAKVNEEITCTLYGSSDDSISGVESKLLFSNNIVIKDSKLPDVWEGVFENNTLLLYTDENKSDKVELLKLTITSNTPGQETIKFIDTKFSDSHFALHDVLNPTYTFTFEAKESDDKADIIDDDKNKKEASKDDEIENEQTGAFLPIGLVALLIITTLLIYIKVKNKKIYKL